MTYAILVKEQLDEFVGIAIEFMKQADKTGRVAAKTQEAYETIMNAAIVVDTEKDTWSIGGEKLPKKEE